MYANVLRASRTVQEETHTHTHTQGEAIHKQVGVALEAGRRGTGDRRGRWARCA